MRRSSLFVLAALLVALAPASEAVAQPQPPVMAQRPTFSPYLNLLNRGGSPALNYFGIVRPQLQAQQQFGQLNQQLRQANTNIEALENAPNSMVDPTLPLTGHAAVFNNTGHYFSSHPVSGSGGGSSRMGSLGGYGQSSRISSNPGSTRASIGGQAPRAPGSTLRR